MPNIKFSEFKIDVNKIIDGFEKSFGNSTYPLFLLFLHLYGFPIIFFSKFNEVGFRPKDILFWTYTIPILVLVISLFYNNVRKYISPIISKKNKFPSHPTNSEAGEDNSTFEANEWVAHEPDAGGVGLVAIIDYKEFSRFKDAAFEIDSEMGYWRAGISIHYTDQTDLIMHYHKDTDSNIVACRTVYNPLKIDSRKKVGIYSEIGNLNFNLTEKDGTLKLYFGESHLDSIKSPDKDIETISLVAWADGKDKPLKVRFKNISINAKSNE